MQTLRDLYFIQFYFWFRFDALTRSRANRTLKAVGAVTVIETWVVIGIYWWGAILLLWPSLSAEVLALSVLGVVIVLYVGNLVVVRRGGWGQFEERLAKCPQGMRRAWVLLAGTVSAIAFGVLLSAAMIGKAK